MKRRNAQRGIPLRTLGEFHFRGCCRSADSLGRPEDTHRTHIRSPFWHRWVRAEVGRAEAQNSLRPVGVGGGWAPRGVVPRRRVPLEAWASHWRQPGGRGVPPAVHASCRKLEATLPRVRWGCGLQIPSTSRFGLCSPLPPSLMLFYSGMVRWREEGGGEEWLSSHLTTEGHNIRSNILEMKFVKAVPLGGSTRACSFWWAHWTYLGGSFV